MWFKMFTKIEIHFDRLSKFELIPQTWRKVWVNCWFMLEAQPYQLFSLRVISMNFWKCFYASAQQVISSFRGLGRKKCWMAEQQSWSSCPDCVSCIHNLSRKDLGLEIFNFFVQQVQDKKVVHSPSFGDTNWISLVKGVKVFNNIKQKTI